LVLLSLATDNNTSTGDPDTGCADYVIQLQSGAVGLFQWQNNDFVFATSQTSLTYAYPSTGPTIHVSASDLGRTKAIKFVTLAISGIGAEAGEGGPHLLGVARGDRERHERPGQGRHRELRRDARPQAHRRHDARARERRGELHLAHSEDGEGPDHPRDDHPDRAGHAGLASVLGAVRLAQRLLADEPAAER